MTKTIFKTVLFTLLTSAFLYSCSNSPEEKVADANENLEEAKTNLQEADLELAQARLDSAEYESFKQEMNIKILDNERKIAQLKVELKTEKKEVRDKYESGIKDLEKKNAEMKDQVKDFKTGTSQKWDDFKLSVNQRMDSIGKSLSEMSQRNINKK
jgi:chromosome segregation ATPase